MTDSRTDAAAGYPTSHYFVAVARASGCRTFKVRAPVAWMGGAALALTAVWGIGAGLYLGFHDDLLAGLIAREAQMQYAYEDRIATLRNQVDQEASRNLTNQSSFDAQLRALAKRATALETRSSLLGQLAGRVTGSAQAPQNADLADDAEIGGSTGSIGGLPIEPEKPHPELDTAPVSKSPEHHASLDLRLATVTASLEHADAAQYSRLADIAAKARKTSTAVREAIVEAGLSPDRFDRRTRQADVGGPFVPLDEGLAASPFGQALQGLQADLGAAERMQSALPHIPFASPVSGPTEVTSPFGARLDPFLGRPALHTGVDLRESEGSGVRVTADGKVVSAGPAGGYGNMIEVDHGNGLSTRYAHLSQIDVTVGQMVTRGAVIGEVGSTGRATGPHLHYETRIDGEPVNPMRFLEAGQRLAMRQIGTN